MWIRALATSAPPGWLIESNLSGRYYGTLPTEKCHHSDSCFCEFIFAGFLARAMNDIGSIFQTDFQKILQGNVEKANLAPEAMAELGEIGQQMASANSMSEAELSALIANIQDPSLQEVVQASVSEVTKIASQNGFDGMYTTAAILGLLIVILAFVLKPLRKNLIQP